MSCSELILCRAWHECGGLKTHTLCVRAHSTVQEEWHSGGKRDSWDTSVILCMNGRVVRRQKDQISVQRWPQTGAKCAGGDRTCLRGARWRRQLQDEEHRMPDVVKD